MTMIHEQQGIIAASRIKYYWLGLLLILILIMIGVGGLTRLTNSGLSMVEWKLFMGVIPPLSNDAWLATFDLYKRYPEYQLLYSTMTLSEFKFIFALEYVHRILGRLLGVMVIVPFALLWVKKQLTRYEIGYCFILLGLVSLQGAIGWFMVKSGLVNVPHISHFRLALHFFFALLFMSVTVILLLIYRKSRSFNLPNEKSPQLRESPQVYGERASIPILNAVVARVFNSVPVQFLVNLVKLLSSARLLPGMAVSKKADSDLNTNFASNPISLRFLSITSIFLVVQILYGAFMAGLEAGYISQTYPAMFGELIPSVHLVAGYEQHGFKSLLENATWIHFIHRHLGVITSLMLLGFALQTLIRLKNFKSRAVYGHSDEYHTYNHMYNVPIFPSKSFTKDVFKEKLARKNNPNENDFNEDDFNKDGISKNNINEDNVNESVVWDRSLKRSLFTPRFLDNLPVTVLYAVILLSLTQPVVGILTIMWSIPISLALIHQLLAVLLFQSLVVLFFYRLYRPEHLKYFYKSA